VTLTDAIERALPRIPAGIVSGDLTDDDDRHAFAERLALIYSAAFTNELARDAQATRTFLPTAAHTYTVACKITASDAWPPPAKGTHESNVVRAGVGLGPEIEGLPGTGLDETWRSAMAWSRTKGAQ